MKKRTAIKIQKRNQQPRLDVGNVFQMFMSLIPSGYQREAIMSEDSLQENFDLIGEQDLPRLLSYLGNCAKSGPRRDTMQEALKSKGLEFLAVDMQVFRHMRNKESHPLDKYDKASVYYYEVVRPQILNYYDDLYDVARSIAYPMSEATNCFA